jgi:hypothetical protein
LTSGATETTVAPHGTAPAGRSPAPGAATTAVVLATAPAAGGGCAALLPWQERTVLGALLGRLAECGVADVRVLTRPSFGARVREAVPGANVREAPAAQDDLREIAALAARGRDLLVIPGEVIASRAALSGLVDDPRSATLALTGATWRARHFAYRVRARSGHVVSAASPYHAARRPTAAFLGAIRITADDLPALAASCARLAELVAAPPDQWRAEFERKALMWRAGLWRAASAPAPDEEHDEEPDDEEPEVEPDELVPAGEVDLSADDEARLRTRLAAAPEDVSALVLLGLVRAGADVSSYRLRRLYWWRALSPESIAIAEERHARYDEDKVLLAAAVKSSDGFFTTFFVSPYSRYVARWAARRGITPNQVTTTSMAIGALAALAFATGERWGLVTGAVLLQVAFMTDCVDGQLARYTRQFSKFGAWLDSILDRTKEYVVFAGLAAGATRTAEPVWGLACAALTLQTVRHFSDFTFRANVLNPVAQTVQPPLESALDAAGAAAVRRREAREQAPPRPRRSLPRRLLTRWKRIDRLPGVRWIKKMAAFPIGERFAAMSLSAAFFDASVTFVVLLSWGGFAVVYTLSGRVLRSMAR